MSARKTIFVLCIVLYSVHQASSLKCYTCSSQLDGDCYKNPKQTKYETSCPTAESTTTSSASANFLNSPVLSALLQVSQREGDAVETYDCCTMIKNADNVKTVSRLCQPKSMTDEDIKKAAAAVGITLDFLKRCDSDLCNSSGSPDEPTTAAPSTTTTKAPAPTSSKQPAPSTTAAPGPSTTKAPSPPTTKAPGSSTTVSPGSSSTSTPDSSSSLAIEFWCLASSLLLIFYFKI